MIMPAYVVILTHEDGRESQRDVIAASARDAIRNVMDSLSREQKKDIIRTSIAPKGD